jgi:hypothetical protein
MSGLLIDNNICHYINNADSTGMYFSLQFFLLNVTSVSRSDYASGKVIISNNKCNWIHTSIAYEDNSSLHITNNTLNAYDPIYLNNFNDGSLWFGGNGVTQFNGIDSYILGVSSAITPLVANSWQYAIFVGSNVEEGSSNIGNAPGALVSPLLAAGSNSSCIISENIIDGGIGQNSGTIYLYNLGYIFAQSSSVICNNICKGVTETSGTGALILLGGNSHIVTGNKVYRNQNTIFAYVSYGIFQLPLTTFDGSMTKGIISNNYFDSPWTDNTGSLVSSVSEQLVKLTPINAKTLNWTVNNNINQTNWIAIPLTNGFGLYGGSMYSPITVLGGAATDPNYVKPDQGNTTPTTTDYTLRSNVLALIDSSIGMPPVGRSYYWQENIDKYLPIGSRPVSIQFYVYSTTALDPGSNINVYLSTVPSIPFYDIASFTTGAYPGYLIDNSIGSITSIPQAGVSGSNVEGLLDIELAPSLVNGVTTDVSYNYVSGNGESFSVTIQFLLQRQSSSVLFNVHVTPLYIKYRW